MDFAPSETVCYSEQSLGAPRGPHWHSNSGWKRGWWLGGSQHFSLVFAQELTGQEAGFQNERIWFPIIPAKTLIYLNSDVEQPLGLTTEPREKRSLGSLKLRATSSSSLSVPCLFVACVVYSMPSLNICWITHPMNQLGSGIRRWRVSKGPSLVPSQEVCIFAR